MAKTHKGKTHMSESAHAKRLSYLTQLNQREEQLQKEIESIEQRESDTFPPFNEMEAMERLEEARKNDALDGTNTYNNVQAEVAKERDSHNQQMDSTRHEWQALMDRLALKRGELSAVSGQISKIKGTCDKAVMEEAESRLEAAKKKYKSAAIAMINASIDVDSLESLIRGKISMEHSVVLKFSDLWRGTERLTDVSIPLDCEIVVLSDPLYGAIQSRIPEIRKNIDANLA
jgi:hypothetical protein